MTQTPTPEDRAVPASQPSDKGKLAMYWAASCGGCEISVLGIDDKILDVADAFEIVFWPCVADGKVRDVEDYGARLMSALASVIDSEDPDEIDEIIDQGIPDPVGTFYRFSLAGSLLRRGKNPERGNGNGTPAAGKSQGNEP